MPILRPHVVLLLVVGRANKVCGARDLMPADTVAVPCAPAPSVPPREERHEPCWPGPDDGGDDVAVDAACGPVEEECPGTSEHPILYR